MAESKKAIEERKKRKERILKDREESSYLSTDELFQFGYDIQTLLIEETFFPNNPSLYDFYISDHRPVGIRVQN